jgi:hypothetical protein
VDVWDFRPASEAEVAALIAAGPRDLSRGQRGSGVGLD